MADYFSVYNTHKIMNLNSINPAMLDFLTAGDPEKIKLYYELHQENNQFSAVEAREILGDDRYQQLASFLVYSSGTNKFYTAVAVGWVGLKKNDQDEDYDSSDGLDGPEDTPGCRLTVVVEKIGSAVKYHSFKEGWS